MASVTLSTQVEAGDALPPPPPSLEAESSFVRERRSSEQRATCAARHLLIESKIPNGRITNHSNVA